MTDDRDTRQDLADFLSDTGSGSSVRAVPDDTGKPPRTRTRTRNLRPTFRSIPGPLAAHSADRRPPGAAQPAAGAGSDSSPTAVASPDDTTRRNSTIFEAGRDSGAFRAAESTDQSAAGGRVRGRRAGRPATAGPGPAGSGKAKDLKAPALPAAIKKLVPKEDQPSVPLSVSKLLPTETERADARELFREIGQRFNENRKKSKTAAYAGFRHDLMDNLDTLVMGGAIDLKEATTIITNLEQYTRETEAESTETPATILGRWLRMDAAEAAELATEENEMIDANDQLNTDELSEDGIPEGMDAAEYLQS